jgi:ferredoxin
VATSSYQAMVNQADCNACGICADERCPVNAIKIEETAFVQSNNCIGCDLCVTGCPSEAIKLIRRKEPPETPSTIQNMALEIASEKGKLDKLMKLMI